MKEIKPAILMNDAALIQSAQAGQLCLNRRHHPSQHQRSFGAQRLGTRHGGLHLLVLALRGEQGQVKGNPHGKKVGAIVAHENKQKRKLK